MAEVKMPANEPQKLEKVVKSSVTTKTTKSGIGSEFVKEEPNYVKEYILMEVLLPAVKNTIADIITNATNLFLFGEVSNSSRDDRRHYATRGVRDDRLDDRRERRRVSRVGGYDDFSHIVFSSRADAVTVLNDLKDQIEDYGYATVANLYELVGEDSGHNDNKYGWGNLDRAYIDSVRGGYIIEFPRARYLD